MHGHIAINRCSLTVVKHTQKIWLNTIQVLLFWFLIMGKWFNHSICNNNANNYILHTHLLPYYGWPTIRNNPGTCIIFFRLSSEFFIFLFLYHYLLWTMDAPYYYIHTEVALHLPTCTSKPLSCSTHYNVLSLNII